MTATFAARLTPPTAVDIDRLAVDFLALEEKTDQAYAIALALDEPHERMKEELIAWWKSSVGDRCHLWSVDLY
jgi:hypothetical protein